MRSITRNALKIDSTSLPGVLIITPPTIFQDHRGVYVELYNDLLYQEAGVAARFVQDDISVSRRSVLRGIHGDQETWKLVSCLWGAIYVVVVDCRDSLPSFGRWAAFTLSESNRLQVLVPPAHGVAHLVLSERAIFHYKQSTYYDPSAQFTFRWDDPRFNIAWPIEQPILSRRDDAGV